MNVRLAIPAAIACLLSASPSSACSGDETLIFSCATDEAGTDYLMLCGTPDGARYQFGAEDKPELSFPSDPADAKARLLFAHWREKGLYHASVRFRNGSVTYKLYYDVNSDELLMGGRPADVSAGVDVMKKGKRIGGKECMEAPVLYSDEAHAALGCDDTTRYGRKACAAEAPEVK